MCVCGVLVASRNTEIRGGHMAGGDLFQPLAHFPATDSLGKPVGKVANDDHTIVALGNQLHLDCNDVTRGCWNNQNYEDHHLFSAVVIWNIADQMGQRSRSTCVRNAFADI